VPRCEATPDRIVNNSLQLAEIQHRGKIQDRVSWSCDGDVADLRSNAVPVRRDFVNDDSRLRCAKVSLSRELNRRVVEAGESIQFPGGTKRDNRAMSRPFARGFQSVLPGQWRRRV
jgi:hypothetical protein